LTLSKRLRLTLTLHQFFDTATTATAATTSETTTNYDNKTNSSGHNNDSFNLKRGNLFPSESIVTRPVCLLIRQLFYISTTATTATTTNNNTGSRDSVKNINKLT